MSSSNEHLEGKDMKNEDYSLDGNLRSLESKDLFNLVQTLMAKKPELHRLILEWFKERAISSKEDDSKKDICQILKEINKKLKNQTANVSVSYPKLHYIFSWFYKKININILYHPYFIEIKNI